MTMIGRSDPADQGRTDVPPLAQEQLDAAYDAGLRTAKRLAEEDDAPGCCRDAAGAFPTSTGAGRTPEEKIARGLELGAFEEPPPGGRTFQVLPTDTVLMFNSPEGIAQLRDAHAPHTASIADRVHYRTRGSADGVFPPECAAAIVTGYAEHPDDHDDADGTDQYLALFVITRTGTHHQNCVAPDLDQDSELGGTWHWPH